MLMAAVVLCGCSSDDLGGDSLAVDGRNTLSASIGDVATRTSLAANGTSIVWNEGDAIGVYTSEGNFVKYTIQSGVGTGTAIFHAENALKSYEKPVWAVYPYDEVANKDLDASNTESLKYNVKQYGRFQMQLPDTKDWSECCNGPMYARIDNDKLTFQHLTGLLKMSINGIPTNATKILFKGISSGLTDGYFMNKIEKYDDTKNTYKTDVALEFVSGGTTDSMAVNLPTDRTVKIDKNIYIPMLAKTYGNLSVEILDSEGNVIDKKIKTSSFSIEKGKIYSMEAFTVDVPTSVSTADDFYKAIDDGISNITVTSAIALTNDVELKKESTQITFNVSPTISENVQFKAADNCTISSFNLVYPFKVAADDAPETVFNINLKDCDVNLNSTDETDATRSAMNQAGTDKIQTQTDKSALITKVSVVIDGISSLYLGKNVFLDKLTAKQGTTVWVYGAGSSFCKIYRIVAESGSTVYYSKKTNAIGTGSIEVGSDAWKSGDGTISGQRSRPTSAPAYTRAYVESDEDDIDYWDGTSKSKPSLVDGVYQIKTAAELAWFQSETVPTSATAGKLTVTMDKSAVLLRSIDLDGNPWVGAVIKEATFDGNNHTIYNLAIEKFVMDQQGTNYSPDACVGLFAAAYKDAVIKNITLNGVDIINISGSPKWVGSLVGYSYGATKYTNCVAKNVDISLKGGYSYRVGGLVGYIEAYTKKDNTPTVTFTGCSVNNASISASYSFGGLIGSMFDSATFNNCSTSNITLSLNDKPIYYGVTSNFIGDISNVATTYARTIEINNCSATDLTTAQKSALGFSYVVGQQRSYYPTGSKYGECTLAAGKTFVGNCPWCGLVDPCKGTIEGYGNYKKQTIKVDGKELKSGTDFNVCE